ncbi:MAG: tetratricopeptide repeat protein [Phycisphaerales bacterium]
MTPLRAFASLCFVLLVCAGCLLTGCRSGDSASDTSATSDSGGAGEDLVAQGSASLSRGDREAALAQFAKAIEVNPRLTRAHLGMGDVQRLSGDYAKAESSYSTAAQIEPLNYDAQYLHGLVLHALNRISDAIGAYLRALQIRPESYEANLNVATAYYQGNEHRQALPYALTAVKLKPDDGLSRANLGAVYAALGQDREAVAEYQQAAERMELTPPLLLNLSESLGRLGRYEEMRNALSQLVKTAPSAASFERLGFAQFKLREYDAARSSFQGALTIDPDYFPALNGLGVCELNTYVWSERRDSAALDRALTSLRRSLQLNRNQPKIEELLTRYR